MDPNEYLADNLDVSKLTVPNLRSILVEHQVYFPSSATKGQLIEIFNNTIKPKASSILKKYNIEPINISDIDKTIPSKRQSDNNSSNLKKTKRKIRKNTTSSPDSSLNSNSNSFLKIEKFEINEQDDIFNGPIDGTPIKLLKKTKYSKKIDSKDILSKFDTSLPSSKNFRSNSKSPSNIDINNNNDESNNNNNDDENNDNDNNNTYNNIFDHQNNEIIFIEEVTNKTLLGPTKNIKDSIIIATSDNEINEQENDNDNDDNEEIELLKDNVQEKLVSKIDVKSLSSFESDEISFSQDSIDSNNINSFVEDVENFIEKSNDKSLNELSESLVESADSIKEGEIIHEIQIEKSTENAITEESSDLINPKEKSTKLSSFFFFISKIILIIFGILNIILPLIVIFSVREIQKNVGYCGFESPPKLLDIWHKIPEPLSNKLLPIQPYIENFESFMIDLTPVESKKCPSNGKCTLNTLTCDFNYIKKSPLSSFFGLIPLEEYCEYDFLHEEKMRYLFDYTLSYLHRHNENPLTVDELHDYLKSTRPSNIRSDEFEEYWNNFVKSEIEDNNNSVFTINHNTNEITLSHLTPTEYYTKTFGNVERNKKSKNLFKKTPPTVDLQNYYTARQ
jgi:hypothetical protein